MFTGAEQERIAPGSSEELKAARVGRSAKRARNEAIHGLSQRMVVSIGSVDLLPWVCLFDRRRPVLENGWAGREMLEIGWSEDERSSLAGITSRGW